MSLEAVIEENTATLKQLIAAWNQLTANATTLHSTLQPGDTLVAAGVKVARIKSPAPKPAATASTPAESASGTPPNSAESEAAAPTATTSAAALCYPEVGMAITNAVKTHREEVVTLLAKFGVKRGNELAVEQYDEFMSDLHLVMSA